MVGTYDTFSSINPKEKKKKKKSHTLKLGGENV